MALDVGEFEVDLVVHYLVAAFLVDDGGDGAREHEVGADFLAGLLLGVGRGVAGLAGELVAEFGTFLGVGDEVDAAGVDERAFHVLDEGLDVDVLVALVGDLADHDGRYRAALVLDHVVVPGTAQAVVDHFLGDEAGIGVVPGAGEVRHGIRVDAGDLLAAVAAADEQGEGRAQADFEQFGHVFLLVKFFIHKYKKREPPVEAPVFFGRKAARLLFLLAAGGGVELDFDGFFALHGHERFGGLAVAAFCADHVVAGVEVVDGERCAVGLVGVFTVDEDEALARLGRHLDVALGNLGAVVEGVALVVARPHVHALVHELVALVDDDEGLAARLDGAVFDGAVAQEFTTEVDFAVGRVGDDGDGSGLATGRWIVVGDGCGYEESHHKGKNVQFLHGLLLFVCS